MSYPALFFEVTDKIIAVEVMYCFFLILGGFGLLLGLLRWWGSAIWFVFTTLLISTIFISYQIEEFNLLYEDIIREMGESYFFHSYFSVSLGILLNLIGIFIGIFKRQKTKLS